MGKKENGMRFSIGQIVTIILALVGLGGGLLTLGDRIFASKESVAVIRIKVNNIDEKVTVIYNAFMEAARHARLDTIIN